MPLERQSMIPPYSNVTLSTFWYFLKLVGSNFLGGVPSKEKEMGQIFSCFLNRKMPIRCISDLKPAYRNRQIFQKDSIVSREHFYNDKLWIQDQNKTICDSHVTICSQGYLWTIPEGVNDNYESVYYNFKLTRCGDEEKVNFSVSLMMIGYSIGVVVFGWMMDNYGRKPITSFVTIGINLVFLGLSSSQSLSQYYFWYFILGMFINGTMNSVVITVQEIIGDDINHLQGVHTYKVFYSKYNLLGSVISNLASSSKDVIIQVFC